MRYYRFVYQDPKEPHHYIEVAACYCTLAAAKRLAKQYSSQYSHDVFYVGTKHR